MPFIKSFSFELEKKQPFPFNVPAVQFAKQLKLDNHVTIFVGDNGCGKSTILECIAYQINLPLIGGYIQSHAGFDAARVLDSHLKLVWQRRTRKGFFFRAEDFSDFINSVERDKNKIADSLRELKGEVDDSIIDEMSNSMNYSLFEMRKQYGDNMQAYSHGEAYLKILETRIQDKGIYLLDEPEAALSPLKQLSLISFLMEVIDNNSQIIMATHSPIIMGIPNAVLYEVQDDQIMQVNYEETEHYKITKTFLENREIYLRHLR